MITDQDEPDDLPAKVQWEDAAMVRAWAARLETGEDVLRSALIAVGPSIDAVKRLLNL